MPFAISHECDYLVKMMMTANVYYIGIVVLFSENPVMLLIGFLILSNVKVCVRTPNASMFCLPDSEPIMWELRKNMTSSTKPEVHSILQRSRRVSSHDHNQHAQTLMKFRRVDIM